MNTVYFVGKDAFGAIVPGTVSHTREEAEAKPLAVGVFALRINLEDLHADPAAWETTKRVFRLEGLL